ncbi:retropepsin-like domain-containing protein [Dehalococcoidia bacterium]|nr:retropepsin-like domain-containing protein [Dehalococcoidia bacterium]
MGRIRQTINIHGRNVRTLFDTGARNTYIIPDVAAQLTITSLPRPTYTKLGGETKVSSQAAVLVGEIDGKPFHTEAMVIDRIGNDEEEKAIEVLFGALAMQQWGIRLIPEQEKLDLSHYPTEFTEF